MPRKKACNLPPIPCAWEDQEVFKTAKFALSRPEYIFDIPLKCVKKKL